ncbi:putative Ribokinase [Vibrio nigripulchritudo MADA3029]|uniref:carbohydrate kinase family protein n=1 Tax=Vibrio nigripulchritudo TaxID=28173 RepID=UPI0003B1C202|nr:carbohydrate kinase family protein [Vibrio nigripulchritudo]CCN50476.1 putative Ribokinase [Vibrio nigripulchritudo MADA3020]CCN52427.1 putative Ribokinase [Vibrio nigripulchritudo MADA3021]CCN62254.1 putative Ribokinase [Vibrio nigripulchritudo MADA3029]
MDQRQGILCIGNWIVDLVHFVSPWPEKSGLGLIENQVKGPGGCAFNVSIGLSVLDDTVPVYGCGVVGDDEYGQFVLDICHQYGFDYSWIKSIPGITAHTHVMTDTKTGERTFFYQDGVSAKFSPVDIPYTAIGMRNIKMAHFGYLLLLKTMDSLDANGLPYAVKALKQLKILGLETSLDMVSTEIRDVDIQVTPCLKYVDHLIINELEAGYCLQMTLRKEGSISSDDVLEAGQALLDKGVNKNVIIHMPEGAAWVSKYGDSIWVESLALSSEDIVSSVGAGDAFCSACLWGIYNEISPVKTLHLANANAAECLKGYTTVDSLVSIHQIRKKHGL